MFCNLQINYKIFITLFLHLLFLSEKFGQNKIEKQDKNKNKQGLKKSWVMTESCHSLSNCMTLFNIGESIVKTLQICQSC